MALRRLTQLISVYQARALAAPGGWAAPAAGAALLRKLHALAERGAAPAAAMEPEHGSAPPEAGAAASASAAGAAGAQQAAGAAVTPASLLRAASPPLVPGVKKTFYKRVLPCPPAIEFSSPEGRQVFQEALQAGTMTGFFKLIEQLSTQDEPAFCGLASLAMVLNALAIDPRRTWKGSWRWFHEKLLDCCLPLDKVAAEGIAACLAKCNGARVELHRAGTFDLPWFRRQLLDCAASGEEHIVVSYSRRTFEQTGDGHFSPVGGVHEGRDMALILDTARFKYPPHWVPIPLLFDAMAAPDPATGAPRGFMRLAAEEWPDSVLFTLDLRGDGWRGAAAWGHDSAPAAVEELARSGAAEPEAIVRALAACAPLPAVAGFVALRFSTSLCARDRCVPHAVRQQALEELRATPLYQMVLTQLQSDPRAAGLEFAAEKLTMLLLLQPPSAWAPAAAWAAPSQHAAWAKLLETSAVSILESEVRYLRRQFSHLGEVVLAGGDEHSVEDCGTCTPRRPGGDGGGGGGFELMVGRCGPPGAGEGGEAGGCCH
ncbi:MAG: Phytochelatin synthase-domain-containing protein [Monoraphidium minutum]|nr:MAG: Phytochelatin synthase-domain-containing protein [Monoraphidium minutum]